MRSLCFVQSFPQGKASGLPKANYLYDTPIPRKYTDATENDQG